MLSVFQLGKGLNGRARTRHMQGVKRGMRRALGGATLAAMSLGALPAVAEVMRITTQFPATNMLTRNLEAFGKRVEEVTEGRVEVQVFPAAQLFKDHDAYNAVATGAIEAGNASTAYVASSVPAAASMVRRICQSPIIENLTPSMR